MTIKRRIEIYQLEKDKRLQRLMAPYVDHDGNYDLREGNCP